MTEGVGKYVLSLCGISLITAFFVQTAGEGKMKSVMKLIGAAAVGAVLMAPFSSGLYGFIPDFQVFRASVSQPRQLDDMRMQAQQMCEQTVEEYITGLGAQQNIDVECSCSCRYTDGAFYLDYCHVTFLNVLDETVRAQFLTEAARGLGVDEKYVTGG